MVKTSQYQGLQVVRYVDPLTLIRRLPMHAIGRTDHGLSFDQAVKYLSKWLLPWAETFGK